MYNGLGGIVGLVLTNSSSPASNPLLNSLAITSYGSLNDSKVPNDPQVPSDPLQIPSDPLKPFIYKCGPFVQRDSFNWFSNNDLDAPHLKRVHTELDDGRTMVSVATKPHDPADKPKFGLPIFPQYDETVDLHPGDFQTFIPILSYVPSPAAPPAPDGASPDAKRPKLTPTHSSPTPATSYIILTSPTLPLKFSPLKAKALGIPQGPLFGQLYRGNPVTLPSGAVVTPEMCFDGEPRDSAGVACAFLNVPELKHLEALSNSPIVDFFTVTQPPATPSMAPSLADRFDLNVVVHMTPEAVFRSPAYQAFLAKFPQATDHIVANPYRSLCNEVNGSNPIGGGSMFLTSMEVTTKLSTIEPSVYFNPDTTFDAVYSSPAFLDLLAAVPPPPPLAVSSEKGLEYQFMPKAKKGRIPSAATAAKLQFKGDSTLLDTFHLNSAKVSEIKEDLALLLSAPPNLTPAPTSPSHPRDSLPRHGLLPPLQGAQRFQRLHLHAASGRHGRHRGHSHGCGRGHVWAAHGAVQERLRRPPRGYQAHLDQPPARRPPPGHP